MSAALRPGGEDDLGMEQSSGYASGYGYQLPLAGEDFDLAGAGKLGKVDGAAAADTGGGEFVGRDGRKLRQELAGVDEEGGYGVRNSGFLHSASLSLRESEAPVGMTIVDELFAYFFPFLCASFIFASISSRVWAWVISNSATAVRRRDSRWAPEPRRCPISCATERM